MGAGAQVQVAAAKTTEYVKSAPGEGTATDHVLVMLTHSTLIVLCGPHRSLEGPTRGGRSPWRMSSWNSNALCPVVGTMSGSRSGGRRSQLQRPEVEGAAPQALGRRGQW